MKRFFIDQALFLSVGIAILILIPILCGPILSLMFEIVVVLCWCYLCRRILLLPFDLFLGKATQTVYFSTQCGIEDLDFFKDTNYYVWKFYFENDQTLKLLVPIAVTKEEADKIVLPQKDVKLRITYYRLSKILLQWTQS